MKPRSIHIILATTLSALLLWISVSMTGQYQIQVTAPLVVRGVPPGRAISNPLPRAVRLAFHDSGWRLAKVTWGPGIEWVIDLDALPVRPQALTLRDVGEQIGGQLGVLPISMFPETIFVSLDTIASKRISVRPNISVTFREGFAQVGPMMVSPESVIVTGALRVLQQMHSWPTAPAKFDQLRQGVKVMVPLSDSIPSLVFNPDRVQLQIDVQQYAEKTFPGVPVEIVSLPQNREVILTSPRIDIVVRAAIDQLAALRQSNIRVVVDYRDILADTSGFIEPEVALPPGIRVVKKSPERINYVVRKK